MPVPSLAQRLWSRPYLLLIVAALGWSANAVAGRLAVGRISPSAIVTLRWLIVVAVLALVVRRVSPADWAVLRRRWLYVVAMGGLGFTVFNSIFYWSAHYTTAVNMGVIQGVTPAMVMLGGLVAYGTPVRALQVVGIVASFIGVVVIASRGDLEALRAFAFNVGDLGILVCSAMYACYTVGLRSRPRVAPAAFFAGLALAAFLTSLPLIGWEIASGRVVWPDATGWVVIALVALWPSLASQLLYIRAIELIGPSRAGMFTNLIPLFSAGMGVLLLGEPVGSATAVALVLIVGGIWIAEQSAVRAV